MPLRAFIDSDFTIDSDAYHYRLLDLMPLRAFIDSDEAKAALKEAENFRVLMPLRAFIDSDALGKRDAETIIVRSLNALTGIY